MALRELPTWFCIHLLCEDAEAGRVLKHLLDPANLRAIARHLDRDYEAIRINGGDPGGDEMQRDLRWLADRIQRHLVPTDG